MPAPIQKESDGEDNAERNIILGLHYLAREANGASLARLAALIKDSIRGYLFDEMNEVEDDTWH